MQPAWPPFPVRRVLFWSLLLAPFAVDRLLVPVPTVRSAVHALAGIAVAGGVVCGLAYVVVGWLVDLVETWLRRACPPC